MSKQLKDKAIKIKGKDYVQVKDRILYLSDKVKNYSVSTDYEYISDRRMWIVKATLTIDGNTYTGLAQEIESDNYRDVNASSALENCETSAVGRACAMAGIGVLDSITSVDEITKANNQQILFATDKQIAMLRNTTARLYGLENLEDIDKVIHEILTIPVTKVPRSKVWGANLRIQDSKPAPETSDLKAELSDEKIEETLDKLATGEVPY